MHSWSYFLRVMHLSLLWLRIVSWIRNSWGFPCVFRGIAQPRLLRQESTETRRYSLGCLAGFVITLRHHSRSQGANKNMSLDKYCGRKARGSFSPLPISIPEHRDVGLMAVMVNLMLTLTTAQAIYCFSGYHVGRRVWKENRRSSGTMAARR